MWNGLLKCSAFAIVGFGMATSPDLVLADSSPRAHDGEFFLRLSLGGGSATSSVEDPSIEKFEVSGVQGDINLAAGTVVSPNLALHGTIFGWSLSDPDVEIAGVALGEANADITLTAFGIGATYYVMPANVYVSGSIGAATLSIDAGALESSTDTGVAIDLTVGKEWWTSPSWGLGVAGAFGYHSVPDGSVDENWTGTNFTVRFSATYN